MGAPVGEGTTATGEASSAGSDANVEEAASIKAAVVAGSDAAAGSAGAGPDFGLATAPGDGTGEGEPASNGTGTAGAAAPAVVTDSDVTGVPSMAIVSVVSGVSSCARAAE